MRKAELSSPFQRKIEEMIQIKDWISPQNLCYEIIFTHGILCLSLWKGHLKNRSIYVLKKTPLTCKWPQKRPHIKIRLNACKHSKKMSGKLLWWQGRRREHKGEETESVNTKFPAINNGASKVFFPLTDTTILPIYNSTQSGRTHGIVTQKSSDHVSTWQIHKRKAISGMQRGHLE